MLQGGSRRERTLTDQALAHVGTHDDEHLSNLVGAGRIRHSPGFVVSSHVDQGMGTNVSVRHQRASAELDCGTTAKSAT
jgi:hypothetical protein